MGTVIDLEAARRRRDAASERQPTATAPASTVSGAMTESRATMPAATVPAAPPMLRRLDAAIAALEPLTERAEAAGLGPSIRAELLTISGAVSVGLFDDAAHRAERLARRLRRAVARSG
jgi:hypothetical protein